MRITKVYTRTGDEGKTSLANGERVSKSSLRVAAYGDVDELNSLLGLVRCQVGDAVLQSLLKKLQNELFILGADLATPFLSEGANADRQIAWIETMRRVAQKEISSLEEAIDQYNQKLPPLQEFILPGGSEAGALLHLCRAVARRAERTVVQLAQSEKINPLGLTYLNRLSDFLFVLARYVNGQTGTPEQSADFH